MYRFGQKGFLHLHVILPVLLVLVAVGAIGSYVISKSGASSDTSTGYSSCGTPKKDSKVYAAAVSTQSKFSSASNNDSIRNIAYGLCKQGYLDTATAQTINSKGNYDIELQKAFTRFELDNPSIGSSDGVPTEASIKLLKLTPAGF